MQVHKLMIQVKNKLICSVKYHQGISSTFAERRYATKTNLNEISESFALKQLFVKKYDPKIRPV